MKKKSFLILVLFLFSCSTEQTLEKGSLAEFLSNQKNPSASPTPYINKEQNTNTSTNIDNTNPNDPKINNLFLIIAPPTRPPNCPLWNLPY